MEEIVRNYYYKRVKLLPKIGSNLYAKDKVKYNKFHIFSRVKILFSTVININ